MNNTCCKILKLFTKLHLLAIFTLLIGLGNAQAQFKNITSFGTLKGDELINAIRKDSIYYINDSQFGKVPFKLLLPQNYNSNAPLPMVLLLHGASKLGSFEDAFSRKPNSLTNDDPLLKALRHKPYIILLPYADDKSGFKWPVVKNTRSGYVEQVLARIVVAIKKLLPVNENKVFAMGHSDGADGAFALNVLQPNTFAAFVAYNSMLSKIFANNLYLPNATNRPMYVVHSDLDDIRPIMQTREIVRVLDSLKAPVKYKEYIGYTHNDKHLQIDTTNLFSFLNNSSRNPLKDTLSWETDDASSPGLDWLYITKLALSKPKEAWHKQVNAKAFDKKNNVWMPNLYYGKLAESGTVKAIHKGNKFTVLASRVAEFEILISPNMVNLNNEIVVAVNGKTVYTGKVQKSPDFMNAYQQSTGDRKAVWVNSIKISVP